jgi:hypothetical protein
MKLNYKHLFLVTLTIFSVSCKKYLDTVPPNAGTLDYAFRNRNEAENYLFTCYATLQQFSDVAANAGFTTSSEIVYPNNLTSYTIDVTGFSLIRGTQTSANPGLNFWDGENNGKAVYRSIRRCNTMLENIDQPVDLTAAEKARWIAEVKFLKAYYHYYLVRMYGPIPITDVNLPVTASTEEVRVKRAPVDSVLNYIVGLLDQAIPNLPPTIQNQSTELGRITKSIALSVKAEVLVMQASPLFNGNPDYKGFKDKSGTALFSATYDPNKWVKAAAACQAAITQCEGVGLKLYTFVPPATISRLSDSLKRVLTIQNAVTTSWEVNPELIWALNPTFGDNYQGYCTAPLTALAVANPFSNPGTFAVPIATQEMFYTVNGVPINEDKTWGYSTRYNLQTGDNASRFYVEKGYTTVKAHFAREARFYANIGFDGGIWFGNGILDQENAYYVQARGNGAFAGPHDLQFVNETGYWPKKLVNYTSVYDQNFAIVDFRMPLMRLGGLYLLYAEALNEAYGPTADVFTYIDKVRTRAGLQGVQASWAAFSNNPTKFSTKDGMRQIIHQERRIELCFEAQSGWDLRRWKELQGVLNTPLQGWSIYQEQALNYYRPSTLVTPVFGLKDYLWPIKDQDLLVDPNLVQNPYW